MMDDLSKKPVLISRYYVGDFNGIEISYPIYYKYPITFIFKEDYFPNQNKENAL
jgi:hypothetical protein